MAGGRPSDIDRIIGRNDDTGEPITVADRIIAGLRAGAYLEPSVAATGVAKSTVYAWIKTAGRIRLRSGGEPTNTLPDLTDHERKCCAFLDAVEEAEGIYEIAQNTTLERLGRGGLIVRTVTRKFNGIEGAPNVECIETTVKEETLPPNAAVVQWRLTRRFQERYSAKFELDTSLLADGALTEAERATALADSLRDYLQGVRDAEQALAAKQPKKKSTAPARKK